MTIQNTATAGVRNASRLLCAKDTIYLGGMAVSGMDTIGSDPQFFKGDRNIAKTLNIKIANLTTSRYHKIKFLSWLFGREINSTKDLRIGEAMAFINAPDGGWLAWASYNRQLLINE